ncbi:histidine phosphatase family protein [Microbulbifer variabilis]|uniref:histidine phosphatase family protein n=1 Tax=Microbulbifer variabilis TaxID=266805 RepID=UPI001CFE251B|nr:histidine phosphatase family protein [Microbulbifer variabilis]
MIKILLARHGEAAKGPSISDPTLTTLGHRQASLLAQSLPRDTYLELVSSPKLRAQQTAQPLAEKWGQIITIESRVSEIPTPKGISLQQRLPWLRSLLTQNWDPNNRQQKKWRNEIISYLLSIHEDTIVFCHFMVINSVIAHILEDSKIQQFRPDYTSITELRLTKGNLNLVQLGRERISKIS